MKNFDNIKNKDQFRDTKFESNIAAKIMNNIFDNYDKKYNNFDVLHNKILFIIKYCDAKFLTNNNSDLVVRNNCKEMYDTHVTDIKTYNNLYNDLDKYQKDYDELFKKDKLFANYEKSLVEIQNDIDQVRDNMLYKNVETTYIKCNGVDKYKKPICKKLLDIFKIYEDPFTKSKVNYVFEHNTRTNSGDKFTRGMRLCKRNNKDNFKCHTLSSAINDGQNYDEYILEINNTDNFCTQDTKKMGGEIFDGPISSNKTVFL